MGRTDAPTTRRGYVLGALSLLSFVASLCAFQLYAHLHWGFRDARGFPHPHPLTGYAKLASDLLALLGLMLAVAVIVRGPRWLGIVAAVVAVAACAAIPVIM